MARTRYRIHDATAPHFLTATVVGWRPIFLDECYAGIIISSIKHLVEDGSWTIAGYVLMDHHLHLAVQSSDLIRSIRRFKSYTARRIIGEAKARGEKELLASLEYHRERDRRDQRYQLWMSGNQPKVICGSEMQATVLQYIHANPVRRGFVDEPEEWPYSSAIDYAGGRGLVPVQRGFD